MIIPGCPDLERNEKEADTKRDKILQNNREQYLFETKQSSEYMCQLFWNGGCMEEENIKN